MGALPIGRQVQGHWGLTIEARTRACSQSEARAAISCLWPIAARVLQCPVRPRLHSAMGCRGMFLAASILLLCSGLVTADICPRGYWAAEVQAAATQKAINQYSSDRKFGLPFGPIGNTPICRYCPEISCFIMRQETEKKEAKKTSPTRRRPRPHPTQAMTTTPKIPSMEDLFTVFENSTATKAPETQEEANVMMSCAPYANLPYPEQIITYLDCVQIGQRDLYYLFIYTPVNKENEVVPVDCIDPHFLSWIKDREKLKGIELGFPMKKLPPAFFRYYRDIMEVIASPIVSTCISQYSPSWMHAMYSPFV